MFNVGILLYEGCYLSSLSGPIDAFQIANAHIRNQQGQNAEHFCWKTVGLDLTPVKTSSGIVITPDSSISHTDTFDLIYIPAFCYEGMDSVRQLAKQLTPALNWLTTAWQNGTKIGSNCTGTFILAESGLLDGREATTTWWLEKQFRKHYPKVKLTAKSILTQQDNILCAGAMTAFQNMAVHLIEQHFSHELAVQCAKAMLIDISQTAQSPYQDLLIGEISSDAVVAKAQYWLQTHLQRNIDLAELAKSMGLSQRTLIRRFKTELDQTPSTYLQNIRVEAAKRLLENTVMPLPEVIEQIGYSDVSSFSKLFKQRTGLTPAGYRKRFASDES